MKDEQKKIEQQIKEKLGIQNPMAVPHLQKIVVNMGVKGATQDKKIVEQAMQMLEQITGQKPKATKAKKSIATFKLREGDTIGVMVTLRGKRMYDFFRKIVTIVLPRLRDFHGVKTTSFDGRGNYTLGFSEQTVFPEIDAGNVTRLQGMEVCVTTTAKTDEEGKALLTAMGMPFKKIENRQ